MRILQNSNDAIFGALALRLGVEVEKRGAVTAVATR